MLLMLAGQQRNMPAAQYAGITSVTDAVAAASFESSSCSASVTADAAAAAALLMGHLVQERAIAVRILTLLVHV